MHIFSALGCFSPSVSNDIQAMWSENGGQVACSAHDKQRSAYYFCDGLSDPWLPELRSGGHRVVFHADWIRACIDEGYSVPMATYVLDGRFDALNRRQTRRICATGSPSSNGSTVKSSSPRGGQSSSPYPTPRSAIHVTKRCLSPVPANSPPKRSRYSFSGNSGNSTQSTSILSDVINCNAMRGSSPTAPLASETSPGSSTSTQKPNLSESSLTPHFALVKKSGRNSMSRDRALLVDQPEPIVSSKSQKKHRHVKVLFSGHSLPADFWDSIACDTGEVTTFSNVSIAIPVDKLLGSLSHASEGELAFFKPEAMYKGKVFWCTERDRRKPIH